MGDSTIPTCTTLLQLAFYSTLLAGSAAVHITAIKAVCQASAGRDVAVSSCIAMRYEYCSAITWQARSV